MYQPRSYREKMRRDGFASFQVIYKDSDLWISVDEESFSPELKNAIYQWLENLRADLDLYISSVPNFFKSLKPVKVAEDAPFIARKMSEAADAAEVGPMAAVAGAFSQEIGNRLQSYGVKEMIIENGGDLYINTRESITIGLYAGDSKFSSRVGLKFTPDKMPLGVCTSAGTVGHSVSFGKADAVVAVSPSAYYADAYATAIANRIHSYHDIEKLSVWAECFSNITGVVIVIDDKMGAWGDISLVDI